MKKILKNITHQHLRRKKIVTTPLEHPHIHINNQKQINFTSNDYLGLSKHPDVIQAFITGANEFGLGSGSSAQVSGYTNAHHELEMQFAAFLGRERALLFNSGYHANLGVISSLTSRHNTIIADKYSHASIIDGALLSRANYYRFHHQDLSHAESLLQQHGSALLISESVFSMSGKITDIASLATLAKKYHALFMVDDAHGAGILGHQGVGVMQHWQLSASAVDCLVTPLGKSFGSMGAIVSGSNEMIEHIFQSSRTHRYSTALPPAVCTATLAGLNVLRTEHWRHEKLMSLIHYFNRETAQLALPVLSNDTTPIKCILIGDNAKAVAMQDYLLNHGFFTACIRPPTVPVNGALIRLSLNYAHTEADIKRLLELIKEFNHV